MITKFDSAFILEMQDTTYAFQVLPSGHLEHLWYGEKLDLRAGYAPLCEQRAFIGGNMVSYSKQYPQLGLENVCLEYSTQGKGDIREPMVELQFEDGSTTCNFLYDSFRIQDYTPLVGLPSAAVQGGEELVIVLKESRYPVFLELTYVPFNESGTLVRSARLINRGDSPVTVKRLLSCQMDLQAGSYNFISFHGAWAREMQRVDVPCIQGRYVNESHTGTSSNRANPFVMLEENGCGEESGRCWGANLIYSGEHYECVEQNSFGKVRFLSGIQPAGFCWHLEKGESLQAPQAVLSFSAKGYSGLSANFHQFVRHSIVRGPWQFKPRPILVNSWEAAYFQFDEEKILQLARSAQEVGAELFVLDDGWFGQRNSDSSSLGDWWPNPAKLPNGVSGLAQKVKAMGMQFGIWVEPEMVSQDSDCYRLHPDWAIQSPSHNHSEGRNQMILDLTQPQVRAYVLEQMQSLFRSADISYVKWDMNRIFSDRYSPSLPPHRQGEFMHRYVLGLYEILDALATEFPHILFESCAGGGNRFDLGMLCYMQQIWASDNSDAICRVSIQENYTYGYPPSVIGAHVSECPNHQTLRMVPLHTRFHVASFGILGYECDLTRLPDRKFQEIKEQIAFYKKQRSLFQFGDFHRLSSLDGETQWMVVDGEKKNAVALYLRIMAQPNTPCTRLAVKGLDDCGIYEISSRPYAVNVEKYPHLNQKNTVEMMGMLPVMAAGSLLNRAGMLQMPSFDGTGFGPGVQLLPDFSSQLYLFRSPVETNCGNERT